MTNKSQTSGNVLCKYEEYLEPNLKKNLYEMPFMTQSKGRSMHKNRLSGILPPPTINKTLQTYLQKLPEKAIRRSTEEASQQTPTLLSRKKYEEQQSNIFRLEKLFPKSVTIKFEEVLNSIPNNRKLSKKSRSPKVGKTFSPFKVFETAENRFYVELFYQKKRQQEQKKERQSSKNTIDSIFNIRSIKMIKKIAQSLPFREQKTNNGNPNYTFEEKKSKNKFERMLKKQTELSTEFEKQNPPKFGHSHQTNLKLSLKNLRRFEQLHNTCSTAKSRTKIPELKPLSSVHSREQKKQERLSSKSKNGTIFIENKPQSLHNANRSTSMMANKRKSSKQLSPMMFSMNGELLNTSSSQSPNNNKFLDNRLFGSKKSESIFDGKFLRYLTMLKTNASALGIEISFPQSYSRNQFCFYVGNGNNSKLVKQMLKKRWWLGACEDKKDIQKNNVIWTQLKEKAYYLLNDSKIDMKDTSAGITPQEIKQNSLSSQQPKRLIIHNHFEQNEFLGNKKALFYNMKAFYQSQNQNVFDYLPLTFHITSLLDESWTSFITNFNRIKQTDPSAKNIWILKPGENSNRGNGITVHESIESIKSIVSQTGQKQKSTRTYILQKYIQKPFLYCKRKFDIRCYMLLVRINQTIKGFWYKEGYIRTSGYEFTLEDCENSFIHLTNDAIQQHCDNYGKYEDKNKLSYQAFQKYLDLNYNHGTGETQKKFDLDKHILPKLRKVSIDSIKASTKCLGKWRDGLPTFQLFGLDFMIDQHFNPWLIEINTNPCLETQGRVLEKVIVPLLDNVFKLTVDCFIPPPLNWSNSNKHLLSKNVDKNLFELVYDEAFEAKNSQKTQEIKDLPMHMIGQIDEDNEVYEEDEE